MYFPNFLKVQAHHTEPELFKYGNQIFTKTLFQYDILGWKAISAGKPSALIDTRVIYCGDNLDQLKKFPPKKFLFIYFIMQLNYWKITAG